jgi:hypothetical protein
VARLTGISGGAVGGTPTGSLGGGTLSGMGEGTSIGTGRGGISGGAGGCVGSGAGTGGSDIIQGNLHRIAAPATSAYSSAVRGTMAVSSLVHAITSGRFVDHLLASRVGE